MNPYDPSEIEPKWQKYWDDNKVFEAKDPSETSKKKFYALIEFPFLSGEGLHVGHIRSNTAMDVISRKRRMEGWNVLYPIGYDAFGLPIENYAIKTGKQPTLIVEDVSATFRRQLKSLGFSFDWSREINTSDPAYYKWTQWIFLQLLKKDLAYKKKMFINWCPKDLIGLANEEVVDGKCERCGTAVEKKEKEQWMLAITKYADRLDKDLDDVDYQERIKIQQRNWIGKSEGAEITFKIGSSEVKVFTTRPDTLYGVTYLVLSPEHTLLNSLNITNKTEVEVYKAEVKNKTEIERTALDKPKTGVELKGVKAVNPATGEEIPMWIADYVLADYGTGAIMAVPGHDERDNSFAKKFGLPVKKVVEPVFTQTGEASPKDGMEYIKRDAVCCVIRNPKDDTYLCTSWKKAHMHGLVTGGIEEGEDPVTSALREIREETGYKNVKFVKDPGIKINTFFFHRMKKVNRHAHFQILFFELVNEERDELDATEAELHEIVWKKKSELKSFFTVYEGDFVAMLLDNPNYLHLDAGLLVDSGKFTGRDSEDVMKEITESVGGKWVTKYKLRDWIFSRQRYWGEPIPVVHCDTCGIVPLPESELPLKLPEVKNYKPTETGESPLAAISDWVNTTCPTCKGKARRETDTMPNWAGSSWYYLRYVDPKNDKALADKAKLDYWTPVDWYNGGMEHTTLHLLYSRFWHKFLFDIGVVPTKEPYQKRTSHGLILAKGGAKMSKSVGNVVNPDTIVKTVGADALRVYEMFMGPFDQHIAWDENGIVGTRRFIEKVWKLKEKIKEGASESPLIQKTIKKVSDDIEAMKFNTAISSLMIATNELETQTEISKKDYEIILQLLAPFAPHVAEELWESVGNTQSISSSSWPIFDASKISESSARVMVQINGKVRGSFEAPRGTGEGDLKNMALNMPEIKKWIDGKEPKKFIVIPDKVVNIVL